MRHWLLKTEPETFSIADLAAMPGGRDSWDGIRNYQARNLLRDELKLGDLAFIYHSSCAEPGIAGYARVCRESYPDHTAWDPKSPYHDPKSSREAPRWFMVDVEHQETFRNFLPLKALRQMPKLAGMVLLKKGMRLSVQPVTPGEFAHLCALGRAP